MLQPTEIAQGSNLEEILLQKHQFSICCPCQVRLAEWPDDQAVLLVHDKVAAEVIQHDGVVGPILIWELCPDEAQRLAVKDACSAQTKLTPMSSASKVQHWFSKFILPCPLSLLKPQWHWTFHQEIVHCG